MGSSIHVAFWAYCQSRLDNNSGSVTMFINEGRFIIRGVNTIFLIDDVDLEYKTGPLWKSIETNDEVQSTVKAI